MKRPWMKFYPADWRADPCLRMCSIGARGMWMEMLAIMHEASPRGRLVVGKSAVSPAQLAAISGVPLKETNNLLRELEAAGVFSREGEIIISRRMLKEEVQAERDRENGAMGGNPKLKGVNPKDKAQMLEARDQSQKPEKQESSLSAQARESESEVKSRRGKKTPLPVGWSPSEAKLAEARKLGLSAHDLAVEITKFMNHARQEDRRVVDWPSAFDNWCLQAAERRGCRPADDYATAAEQPDKVFVREGTPEWDAWQGYLRATTGKGSPCKNGGWYLPSERPPNLPVAANGQVH